MGLTDNRVLPALTDLGMTQEKAPAHERAALRRVIDVSGALVLGVVAAPLVLIVAILSVISYRAWPLFTHNRVGSGGHDIRITKARTLPPSTNRYAAKYDLADAVVPRSMRAVRLLHLDELPQLWNVLRGEMSFVGPRPEMRFLHDRLPSSFAETRVSICPGVTGLWQISHGSNALIGEHPEFDLFYVRHRTLRLDAWIVYRTLLKMLTGRTVGLDQVPSWTLSRELTQNSSATI